MSKAKDTVLDPLEAAKLAAPIKEAAAARASDEKLPDLDENFEEPKLASPSKVSAAPPASMDFRVLVDITVSWGGQFLRLAAGDVLSDKQYGPGAMERMRVAGVALERC